MEKDRNLVKTPAWSFLDNLRNDLLDGGKGREFKRHRAE
jgi:hypothetical protein